MCLHFTVCIRKRVPRRRADNLSTHRRDAEHLPRQLLGNALDFQKRQGREDVGRRQPRLGDDVVDVHGFARKDGDNLHLHLVETLLKRDPSLRVLLTSGYADQKLQWSVIRAKGYRFLPKPYPLTDLLQTVQDILSPASAAE